MTTLSKRHPPFSDREEADRAVLVLETASVIQRWLIIAYISISIGFNLTAIGISASLWPRFTEILDDFKSCPSTWLQKQGRIIYDWNTVTLFVLIFFTVHTLLKCITFYEQAFDPSYAMYTIIDSGENGNVKFWSWTRWKVILYKILTVFLKLTESFLAITSILLPTVMWAYFYIFPFDTLNGFALAKHEGTSDYLYSEAWRTCIPKHTDDVYNALVPMMVCSVMSAFLLHLVDFAKNPAKAILWFFHEMRKKRVKTAIV
ncbi:hypothetical protein CYMTET_47751 [Cymbomonas tetramitiformis]|uniref:Uncharacterized protein n=1 Tax=Cymbomonas tetramitiformis TaxID=36881 RepID=A0AAE0BVL2_9CHLO|nr:hypothetical protein CYMTET_47751 [Cymbomonas tetramitiformis]